MGCKELWDFHSILATLSVVFLLPLGVRLARLGSWMHKPFQLMTTLMITIASAIGHSAHVTMHKEMHETYHLRGFHSLFGWLLVTFLWMQVGSGWFTSSWNRSLCFTRKELWRTLHRCTGFLFFPLLWIQWLSGLYAIFHLSEAVYLDDMRGHTTMGLFLVAMGIYYLSSNSSTAYVEALGMTVGGFVVLCAEASTTKDFQSFIRNATILAALLWMISGWFGFLLQSIVPRSSMKEEMPSIIPSTGIEPLPELESSPEKKYATNEEQETATASFRFRVAFIPLFLVVLGHATFIFLQREPLEDAYVLHRLHAGLLVFAFLSRVFDSLHITGCSLILSGVTFICAQSGLCMLASQWHVAPNIWVLLSLLFGVWMIILSYVHLVWFGILEVRFRFFRDGIR